MDYEVEREHAISLLKVTNKEEKQDQKQHMSLYILDNKTLDEHEA